MKYALKLANDKRILSACKVLPNGNYDGMSIVDEIPEGDLFEYLYMNGGYVYDPKPVEPEPEIEPTLEEILDALLGV